MPLLVGLGNPGAGYRTHRHNVGFMVLDALNARIGASEWREKWSGLTGKGVLAGREVVLFKPQTFMNLSGRAVQKAMTQLGVPPGEITVVHDDIDLALGDVRVKVGGGHGGHNGLRDISAAIGADYVRVRVGVGRPTQGTVEQYVLAGFAREDEPAVAEMIGRACTALESVIADGADRAMNATNVKPKK